MAKSTVSLILNPADLLMFRDSRPFGEGGEARSQMATPQTIAGAIRQWLLSYYGISLSEINAKHPKQKGQLWKDVLYEALPNEAKWVACFCLDGPILDRNGFLYAPLPRHLACDESNKILSASPLAEDIKLPIVTGAGATLPNIRPLWIDASKDLTPINGWLDMGQLVELLENPNVNSIRERDIEPDDQFFMLEEKVQCSLDAENGRAADGMLYTSVFLRMKQGVGLRVSISSQEFKEENGLHNELSKIVKSSPWLLLGGEQRIATVGIVEDPYQINVKSHDSERRIAYLLTPGIFYGFYPRKVVEGGWWLRGAATGEPYPVSGWDGSRARPRPQQTRYAVRAGSVFFWEKHQPKTVEHIHVSADHQDNRAGWGHLIWGGEWNYAE